MKNKLFIPFILLLVVLSLATTNGIITLIAHAQQGQTKPVKVGVIGSNIVAIGAIHSQSEATIHFQTGGKLIYLPFKEGDYVTAGQTIGQLDTYPLQQQLTQALNNYRSTRDIFDQSQQNSQTGVLQQNQKNALNPLNQSSIGGDAQSMAINNTVQRIIDQNQANLDNAVINVQLASYALQLATLTSPINGIITHEDVTVANVNVTPVTSFSIADPKQLILRVNVAASDIDYVSVGAPATIQVSGQPARLPGTVIKIYPQKQTLPDGEEIYQVDIQSTALRNSAKFGQQGSAVIQSNIKQEEVTVPTWTVLGHTKVWVLEDGKPVLKTITIGNISGDTTEITGGLLPKDKVITDPRIIAAQSYKLL